MKCFSNGRAIGIAACIVLCAAAETRAEVKVTVEHIDDDNATPDFKFKDIPAPSTDGAATQANFTIVDGKRDGTSGGLDKLNDGKLPTDEDQPRENFKFANGTDGGRIGVDLNKAIDIKQVNTYSWHPNTRGPQVYKLYASDGAAPDFLAGPTKDTDPEKCGWKLIATVDTRPKVGTGGGQYGVSISDTSGVLGKYRYFLFDISRTESDDVAGNTFYSEIDVIEQR